MILHVGMHKTGTSSLQNSLAAALVDDRFRFIRLGGMPNGSLILGNAYADLDEYPHDPKTAREVRVMARRNAMIEVTEQLALTDGRRPILSAELVSALSPDQKAHMLDLMLRFHEDMQVAAYLRRPKSFIQSALQERLKHYFLSLDTFTQPLAYEEIFTPFDQALGNENVLVRVFAPDCLHAGCVVEDFAHLWGIDLDRDLIERDNPSFSAEAVKLLYIYRRRNRTFDAEDLSLLDFLGTIEGRSFRLHSSVCLRAAVLAQSDIDWASARTGIEIAEDWTTDDDSAIAAEADLLAPEVETLDTLAQQVDMPVSRLFGDIDVIADALSLLGRLDRRDPSEIGRAHRQMLGQ